MNKNNKRQGNLQQSKQIPEAINHNQQKNAEPKVQTQLQRNQQFNNQREQFSRVRNEENHSKTDFTQDQSSDYQRIQYHLQKEYEKRAKMYQNNYEVREEEEGFGYDNPEQNFEQEHEQMEEDSQVTNEVTQPEIINEDYEEEKQYTNKETKQYTTINQKALLTEQDKKLTKSMNLPLQNQSKAFHNNLMSRSIHQVNQNLIQNQYQKNENQRQEDQNANTQITEDILEDEKDYDENGEFNQTSQEAGYPRSQASNLSEKLAELENRSQASQTEINYQDNEEELKESQVAEIDPQVATNEKQVKESVKTQTPNLLIALEDQCRKVVNTHFLEDKFVEKYLEMTANYNNEIIQQIKFYDQMQTESLMACYEAFESVLRMVQQEKATYEYEKGNMGSDVKNIHEMFNQAFIPIFMMIQLKRQQQREQERIQREEQQRKQQEQLYLQQKQQLENLKNQQRKQQNRGRRR